MYKSDAVKKPRLSNIELLRNLSMSAVIFLHYFNAEIGGGYAYVPKGSFNELILVFLESISICAVNLFIMISAYFLSQSQKRSIGRCILLFFHVAFFREVSYVLSWLLSKKAISIHGALYRLLPANWFVVLYVVLYLVSPLINSAFKNLKRKTKVYMIGLIVILFSFWPTVVDIIFQCTGSELLGLSTVGMYGSQRGYTITQFMVCYCLGSAIKDIDLNNIKVKGKQINQFHLVAIWLAEVLLITIWSYINPYTSWEYCNPLVILEALTVFCFFLRLDIRNGKVINSFASASFTVFLLHNSLLQYAQIEKAVNGSTFVMMVNIIVTIFSIVLISWIADRIYKSLTYLINKKLESFVIFIVE